LAENGLDAGDVATDGTHAGGVLKLVGRLLEAQVERFLLELNQAVAQLVRRLRTSVLRLSCRFLFHNRQTAPCWGSPMTWRINDKPPTPSHPGIADAPV
jgi:hypothetical protein